MRRGCKGCRLKLARLFAGIGGKFVLGGWGGIRTHGERKPTAVFKTAALNHSATHPEAYLSTAGALQPAYVAVVIDLESQPNQFATWV